MTRPDLTKKYRYINATSFGPTYTPLDGPGDEHGKWPFISSTGYGCYLRLSDLKPVPEPWERWINLYADGGGSVYHQSKADAEAYRSDCRGPSVLLHLVRNDDGTYTCTEVTP